MHHLDLSQLVASFSIELSLHLLICFVIVALLVMRLSWQKNWQETPADRRPWRADLIFSPTQQ